VTVAVYVVVDDGQTIRGPAPVAPSLQWTVYGARPPAMVGESVTHAPGQATSSDAGRDTAREPAPPSPLLKAKLPPSLSGDPGGVPAPPGASMLFPAHDRSPARSMKRARVTT
jgi:hypothetical protein